MYKPVQNGIEKNIRSVRYSEARSELDLAEFVHCFWELKTDSTLPEDFSYHVLPDACVDIIFDLSDPERAIIMTPHISSEVLNLGKKFHYIGIRLLPGVWHGSLDGVVGGAVEVTAIDEYATTEISRKLTGQSFIAQQAVLANLVQFMIDEKLAANSSVTARILAELDDIQSVADMAKVANLSSRQLQRTLKQATGFSPHDLLKVLRLQHSFRQHYLASYTDQPHFIHSFHKITGYTPARYNKNFDV